MKSYTDEKQSRKLAEILPLESADMFYDGFGRLPQGYAYTLISHNSFEYDKPCWSLAVLMDMLPSEFTEKGKYSETTYKIRIRKYAFTKDVDLYQIAYGNYIFYEDGSNHWKDMINTGEKENLIDAVFQMVCWLKENKKI